MPVISHEISQSMAHPSMKNASAQKTLSDTYFYSIFEIWLGCNISHFPSILECRRCQCCKFMSHQRVCVKTLGLLEGNGLGIHDFSIIQCDTKNFEVLLRWRRYLDFRRQGFIESFWPVLIKLVHGCLTYSNSIVTINCWMADDFPYFNIDKSIWGTSFF